MPENCALPWQELLDDENGENKASNNEEATKEKTRENSKQTSSNLWNSFVDEKTRQEEEEIDALLLEAEDGSAMDQFLLQAVNEHDPVKEEFATTDDDDLFLLDAAQYLP